jgi:hypothetical protein
VPIKQLGIRRWQCHSNRRQTIYFFESIAKPSGLRCQTSDAVPFHWPVLDTLLGSIPSVPPWIGLLSEALGKPHRLYSGIFGYPIGSFRSGQCGGFHSEGMDPLESPESSSRESPEDREGADEDVPLWASSPDPLLSLGRDMGLHPALPVPRMPPPVLARAVPDRPRGSLPQIDRPAPATPASPRGDRHRAEWAPYRVFLPLVLQAGDPDWISPYGGAFTSPDGRVTVEVPPGALTSPVRLRYAVRSPAPLAPPGAPLEFASDLEATDREGRAVRAFRAPLAPTICPSEALPASAGAVLSVHEPGQGRWVPLPSIFDRARRTLRAWTPHFSTFGVRVL